MGFTISTAGKIVFGRGALAHIRPWIAGRRVFVMTGRSQRRAEPLLQILRDENAPFSTFSVALEPTADLIAEAAHEARRFDAAVVVGMGGGSAVDAGKAVAALMTNRRDLIDYLEVVGRGLPLDRDPAPCIAVPTTAGTGSEATSNAVLAVPERGVKVSLRSPLMLPRLAVVDPTLTVSMPKAVTAATGMDALTQLLESYVSARANAFTDGLCREGLMRAAAALPRAWHDGTDLLAREEMCIASLFSGMALASGGLGAVHGIAGPLGGMISAPHGALCARLLPSVMEANLEALRRRAPDAPAASRYRDVARILCGDIEAGEKDGIQWIRDLQQLLEIPTLADQGLAAADLPALADKARQSSSMKGNPVGLTRQEILDVLQDAL